MSRRNDWNDKIFQALLHDHRPPQASVGLRDRIMAELAKPNFQVPETDVRPKTALAVRTWRLTAIAAVLLIAIGGLGWLAWDAGQFNQPLTIKRSQSGGVAGNSVPVIQTVERGISLATVAGETLRIEGDGNNLELGALSRLNISPAPGHRLGMGGINYELESGSLDLVHGPDGPNFVLKTPFGSLVPLGTAFNLKLEPGANGGLAQVLTVREGAVNFSESNTIRHIVSAGSYLRLERQPDGSIGPGGEGPISALPQNQDSQVALSVGPAVVGPSAQATMSDTVAASPGPVSANPLWSLAAAAGETELIAAGPVLVTVRVSTLSAISLQTGSILWTKTMAAKPQSVLGGSAIFLHTGRELVALDRDTGRQNWSQPAGPMAGSRLVEAQGRLWLASVDGSLVSRDVASGQERSRWELGAGLYGTPLLDETRVFASQLPADFVALAADSGTVLWRFKSNARFSGDRPLLIGSLVVVRDSGGTWHGLDGQSGTEGFSIPADGALEWGPVALGGAVWAQEKGGLFSIDKAGAKTRYPQIAARVFDLRVDGRLVMVATSKGVVMIDGKNRVSHLKSNAQPSWRHALMMGGIVVYMDQDGRLSARSIE